MAKEEYIYGRNPVIEALSEGEGVEKVFLAYGVRGKAVSRIYSLAKKSGTPVATMDKRKFSQLERDVVPKGSNSQGVLAQAKLIETIPLEELIEKAFEKDENPVLLALDEITDPHNLGAAARSAEGAGALGIIVPERNSAPLSAAAVKASAGALKYIPVAREVNLVNALIKCKDAGLWVIGTAADAKKKHTEEDFLKPTVVVIGSEGKGMRPSVQKQCDEFVRIPLKGSIESLNASVSAAVILFEIQRQRKNN